MTEAAERMKSELLGLPEADRAELASLLLESLHEDEFVEDGKAFLQELERRWKDIESGEDEGIPASEVLREIREKYS